MSEQRLDWVAVASFRHEDEARLVAGRLNAEGVEAAIYPEFQGSYYEGVDAIRRPYEVLVPLHRALEARTVLERLGDD